MKKGPRLHAKINTSHGHHYLPVENEDAALQASLFCEALSFQTMLFEIEDTKGAMTQTDAESDMRYVGVDKLYTLSDIAAEFNAMSVLPVDEDMSAFEKDRFGRMSEEFKDVAGFFDLMKMETAYFVRNARYDRLFASPTSFFALKDGMKAFDKQGQQIWPKP